MKPSVWLHNRNPNMFQRMGFDENEDAKYIWSNDMVSRILKCEPYIGNTINYRDRKATYKSKLTRQPKESWLIIPNTHEPIIDMECGAEQAGNPQKTCAKVRAEYVFRTCPLPRLRHKNADKQSA